MAYQHPEDDDDQARAERAEIDLYAITVTKLGTLELRGAEGEFVRRMDLQLCILRRLPGTHDLQRLKDMAWKYRRQMPRHLAPKLPPHDPIVRELEGK